jgi:hypothetical protein
MVNILHLAAGAHDLPAEAGERPQVVIMISLDSNHQP